MIVAISHIPQSGPYGGGNSFVKGLVAYLTQHGHSVVYTLHRCDIDAILITDPRGESPNIGFSPHQIYKFVKNNPRTIVIHRINECDERKKTKTMNLRLRAANILADHTVYVGSWMMNLRLTARPELGKQFRSVILNGSDPAIFNPTGRRKFLKVGKIKLVTHHWGGNMMKGFDVYSYLDELLGRAPYRDRLDFTYVGNLPHGFQFKNSKYIPPLANAELADELKMHHIYLTASKNEPGGNHQNEGAQCGLPLLYRNSGCLPEYCSGFGESFHDTDDFEKALERLLEKYDFYWDKILDYPHCADKTLSEWLKLLESLNGGGRALFKRDFKYYYNVTLNAIFHHVFNIRKIAISFVRRAT